MSLQAWDLAYLTTNQTQGQTDGKVMPTALELNLAQGRKLGNSIQKYLTDQGQQTHQAPRDG